MNQLVYHDHLDRCRQCREEPHNLCRTGATLLRRAVTASSNPVAAPQTHRTVTWRGSLSDLTTDLLDILTPIQARALVVALSTRVDHMRPHVGKIDATESYALALEALIESDPDWARAVLGKDPSA